MKKIKLILVTLGLIFASSVKAEGFNPNYILDDNEIYDNTSMGIADIQQFLTDRGSYLATMKTKSCLAQDVNFGLPCSGPELSMAEIIYDRATTNHINPKFILVLLQKEMSLIEGRSPTARQLDWALGYGCFDNQACKDRYRGIWKQINSATLQFRAYMDDPEWLGRGYQIGQTYTIYNTDNPPSIVTPQNRATCAFYNYTPHVYWGNFNFYKIWSRYFIRDYPNGTLLQVAGEPTIYVLQNGLKRPFKSRGAVTSRYDIKKLITISKADLDKYATGRPITFAQYSIVRAPSGAMYLLVDDTRRGFASMQAFRKLGFNTDEVVSGSWSELNNYREVEPLTATSTFPTGALLQDSKTGGVYWVMGNKKAPVPDKLYLVTLFKHKKIKPAKSADLAKLQTIDSVRFPDGELLRGSKNRTVYVISDGHKRPINSAKVFESLKYSWNNVMLVPDRLLYLYPDGEALKEKTDIADIIPTKDASPLISTSTISSSATSTTN